MRVQRSPRMRILLDESVPARLGRLLNGHECTSAQKRGWAGVKNGQLLSLASGEFDVLLTADKNIEYQQNLATLPMAVLVILAPTNRLADMAPMVPAILRALEQLPARTLQRVEAQRYAGDDL